MPIKISVENNFLKVEGNDPERIYYERSRVSHELLPTYVQLRYDNNKLAQLDLTTLDSTNTAFTSLAAIVAFLTQVGDGDTGDGTVSAGGGGLTPAQAQAAFTAALQSQNQVEFQDILLEDANGVVYISTRQIDEETGTVTFTGRLPDGTAHTPVAPITTPKVKIPLRTDFWANIAGTGYSVGDRLERVITGSDIVWFNRTLETTLTTPPTLTNLVADIRQAVITVTQTSVASTSDLPNGASISVDSPIIPIPTIDKYKANSVWVYRASAGVTSPLYSGEIGYLGLLVASTDTRIIATCQAPNRQRQLPIIAAGSRSFLDKGISGVFVRNFNVGTNNLVFEFSYDPDFTKDASIIQPETKTVVVENAITSSISTPVFINADIAQLGFYVRATGVTSTASFTLEQLVPIGGVNQWFPVSTISLAPGAVVFGFNTFNLRARGGQFRITFTGTITNYSYRILFN